MPTASLSAAIDLRCCLDGNLGKFVMRSDGQMWKNSVRAILGVVKFLPPKWCLCWNEQVRRGWCVKLFEQSSGLDTVLCRNVPFYNDACPTTYYANRFHIWLFCVFSDRKSDPSWRPVVGNRQHHCVDDGDVVHIPEDH